jgi:hypothetical protein
VIQPIIVQQPQSPPAGYQQAPMGYQQQAPAGYQQAPMGYQQQAPAGYQQQAPAGYYQQAPVGYQQAPMGYQQQPVYAPMQQQGYAQAPMGYAPVQQQGFAPAPQPVYAAAPQPVFQQQAPLAAAFPLAAALGAVAAAQHHNPYSPININKHFCLKTAAGGNLRAEADGDMDGKGAMGPWATWHVVDAKDGRIRLQNEKQKWMTLKPDGQPSGKGQGGPNCYFRVVSHGGHRLSLQGVNGFIAIHGNGTAKNAKHAGQNDPHAIFEYIEK